MSSLSWWLVLELILKLPPTLGLPISSNISKWIHQALWSSSQALNSQSRSSCMPGSQILFPHPSSSWSSWFYPRGKQSKFSMQYQTLLLDPTKCSVVPPLHLALEVSTLMSLDLQLQPLNVILLRLIPQSLLSWPSVSSIPYSSGTVRRIETSLTHSNEGIDGNLGGEVSNVLDKAYSTSVHPFWRTSASISFSDSIRGESSYSRSSFADVDLSLGGLYAWSLSPRELTSWSIPSNSS